MPIRRKHYRKFGRADDMPDIVRLWLLRMLVPLGAHREFIGLRGFGGDDLAGVVGLGHWVAVDDSDGFEDDPEAPCFDAVDVLRELRHLHAAAERKCSRSTVPAVLKNNVGRLARLAGLSAADASILEFTVLIHNDRLLDDTGGWLGQLSTIKMFHALAVLLDLPESAVRDSLAPGGALSRSGLVSVDRHGMGSLRSKLELLSDFFGDLVLSTECEPVSLLRNTVAPATAPHLAIDDYAHLDASLAILRPYLRKSLAGRRQGVNVFFHGRPGTGKSQLARALAADLGCELFEVASEDADGDPLRGDQRLRAFRAAQNFLARRSAMIVFDEAEDLFDDSEGQFGRKSTAQVRKASINRMLEDNQVPTLWLSNDIGCLDPAFVRRFDMVIELPVPPKAQRIRIIREACADMLDARTVARMAESEDLAPALVTRAASVVGMVRDEVASPAAAIARLVSSTLEAQGHHPLRCGDDPVRLPETYDPAFINADADLVSIAAGLARTSQGRLCLYGPSGSGKTAWGRWVAEQLGAPLHIRRASDLLDMYVGGTEKNIARAFRDAESDGAVLLVDEVDSFLQDRRDAVRSWEVSHVNEMLTRMESFAGVLIASTNLMAGLDQAALRRFDLKVKFGFLKPEQAWALLCRHCAGLAFSAPAPELLRRLAQLVLLTPGDYAAVIRRHRFSPLQSAEDMVDALGAECAGKEGERGAIGFV